MDPPSYGRGPGGEVWKLEEQIDGLIAQCAALLSDNPLFFAVIPTPPACRRRL